MQRERAAAVVAFLFAAFWSAMLWPWFRSDAMSGTPVFGWVMVAFLIVGGVVLLRFPRIGRWIALPFSLFVLIILWIATPFAIGFRHFNCDGIGWRCYVEAVGLTALALALLAATLRPFRLEAKVVHGSRGV